MDIYLISKAVAAAEGWDVTKVDGLQSALAEHSMIDPTASVKHLVSYDTYNLATEADHKFAENVYLTAGDYYMLVTANEGSTPSEHANRTYAMIRKLILTSEDAAPALTPVVYSFTTEALAEKTEASYITMNTMKDYDLLDSSVSTGKWMYVNAINSDKSGGKDVYYIYPKANGGMFFKVVTGNLGNNAFILKAKLENSGIYKPSMEYLTYVYQGRLNVYVVPVSYADSKWSMSSSALNIADVLADPEVKLIASQNGWVGSGSKMLPGEYDNVYLDKGEYYIFMNLVKGDGASTHYSTQFKTTGITLTPQTGVVLSAPSSTVKIGKAMALSALVANEAGKNIPADIAYTSSDSTIAKVNTNGVVTGVAKGTATIQATATVDGVQYTDSIDITVEPDYSVVSLATANNVNDYIEIDATNTRGTDVKLSAEEIKGYTFRCWVRGTEENGEFVSSDAEFTYKLITNTYLTAVYTKDTSAPTVEFFNGNREYITTAEVVDGAVTTPDAPELTGVKFLNWYTAKDKLLSETVLDKPVTRAVAVFEDTEDTFTVDGEKNLKYDATVTRTSDTPVVWSRDGIPVGYGTEYIYYVWNNVGEITSAAGTAQPLVVLDEHVKDGAYMIEYDAGGKTILEVGILFGNGENMSVDSCKYKATSKKNASHGQFIAKPANDEYDNALGYMIYLDGGEYKVVYSD
ncbi:MAG: Ig domain-containing protein [Oscillospiraceae bacterium]|nr:Ig domain-containing protein [Oscillospiraceae bacterium]